MELQTENGKKKAPLSTGLKWLQLVCMAVVFGIMPAGRDGGDELPRSSMAAEEESIPQTSTVKVTAKDQRLPNLTIWKRDGSDENTVIPGTVFEVKVSTPAFTPM